MVKGMNLEECTQKAENYISKNGLCLLGFDLVNSRDYDSKQMVLSLIELRKDLNSKFKKYFIKNKLRNGGDVDYGFVCVRGDSSCAGINSSLAVRDISNYVAEKYKKLRFYWAIGKDGWDESLKETL
jgi:hypothetical protein